MTWNPAYPAEPTNPPPSFEGPEFDVAVRRSFQGMGRVDVTPGAIPWSAIAIPTLDWQTPTLLNSWVNFSSTTHSSAGYAKGPGGLVYLRGLVKSGTAPTSALFILPADYRPLHEHEFAVASNGAFGWCRITGSSGSVDAVTGSNVWFSLDGIVFDVAS